MAYATMTMVDTTSGRTRTAPVGFSWTTFFFGFFPALLRGHWVGAIAQLAAAIVTLGFSGLVFPFVYNKWYAKSLVADGFEVKDATVPVQDIVDRSKLELPVLAAA